MSEFTIDRWQDGCATIRVEGMTDADFDVLVGMMEAYEVYLSRNNEREALWKRSGVKGQCYILMAKAERAFRQVMAGQVPNRDHFHDTIVYAAFALALGDNLNGEWPWKE